MVSNILQNSKDKLGLPLNTAHRGFSAKYPENSVIAILKAVSEAGADVIETDVQVSGDGLVVISHDVNTKRCFGVQHAITETSYEDVLKDLRTIKEPHVGMPLLKDVASLLLNDESFITNDTKLMLDIKRTNEPWIIKKIVNVLLELKDDLPFWTQHVVLGIWSLDLLQACVDDAPEFGVLHIGVSHSLARIFMSYSNCIGVSLFYGVWAMPYRGSSLYLEAKAMGKACFAWTVNSDLLMRWTMVCQFDGIITDKPDRYHELTSQNEEDLALNPKPVLQFKGYFSVVQRFLLFPLLSVLIKGVRTYFYLSSLVTRKRPFI